MNVFIGSDHNGFRLKAQLITMLQKAGYEVHDEGDMTLREDDDFPEFAAKVATAVLASDEQDAKGIVMCASGQGVCMAANRFKGIRASLCWDSTSARLSRTDDDANVLCLPARLLSAEQAETIVRVWLTTPFAAAARFSRRIRQLDELS